MGGRPATSVSRRWRFLITAPIVPLTCLCPDDAVDIPWFPYPVMVPAVGRSLSRFRESQLAAARVNQMALHLVIKRIA
jgi:hypothetical protein